MPIKMGFISFNLTTYNKEPLPNVLFTVIDFFSFLLNSFSEMEIPDNQETTVRTRRGTDWFQIGKGVLQDCILSPCLFNFMRNAG